MCGLVGMITKLRNGFNGENANFFDQLLFMNSMRGMDSTGVFLVNNIGNVKLAKDAKQSAAFLSTKEYKEIKEDGIRNGWAMIGHSRKATKGIISDKNAHPFAVDEKLVLVHNGSMWGEHKHLKDVEVDSEAIAHTIANGDDVETSLQKINAAYALIWYNVMQKQMYFIRNTQRPLAWLETPNCWYFASEGGMLEFIAERMNITRFPDAFATEFNPLTLNSWKLEEDKSTTLAVKVVDANYRHQEKPIALPAPKTWPVMDNDGTGAIVDHITLDDEPIEPVLVSLRKALVEAHKNLDRREEENKVSFIIPAPPDAFKKHSFEDFIKLKDVYIEGTKVKVEVNSWLNEEAYTNVVMMEGKVQDKENLYAVFPLDKKILAAITDGNDTQRRFTFSVEVNRIAWRRASDDSPNKGPMMGRCTILGKGAKIHTTPQGTPLQ